MVETVTTSSPDRSNGRSNGFSRFLGLSLGLTSVYILLYFAFNSPSVIARWTGANYLLVLALLVLAQTAFAVMLAARPQTLMIPRPAALWAANLLFVLSLLLTVLAHQIRFPSAPGGYPLPEPPVSGLAIMPLVLTLTLSPTLLWDALLIFQALLASQGGESSQMSGIPSFRTLALAFSLASLYLLVMIFAQVFTTVYDYIPVVGPFFRDKSWLVYLVPGLGLLIGLRAARLSPRPQASFSRAPSFAAAVCLAGLFSLAAALINTPRPPAPVGKASLRVLTYNIQQGYSAEGQRSYRAQLEALRQANPDIIGLEESDTARISGGNADLVRYFADRLRLYSYYGPKTVTGTFGIALLSKYPIQNPRTFYMYSKGEQTAVIEAQIIAGGKTYNVFVTHLGNGGPLVQQEQVLEEVGQQPDVIAMGDFNFEPSGEQYRRTTARLADAWMLKWPQGADDQGYNPTKRIDHIFVSPGIQVVDARHLLSPASDHPAVVVEITE